MSFAPNIDTYLRLAELEVADVRLVANASAGSTDVGGDIVGPLAIIVL